MEPAHGDSGQENPGMKAPPALGAASGRKGKYKTAPVASANRRSGSTAAAAAAALFPFQRGSGTTAASSSPRLASLAASGVADSPPNQGRSYSSFNNHGGSGFTGTSSSTSGFSLPPSPSQALCDSASASPISPSFVHPPSWDPTLSHLWMRLLFTTQ